jgi:peptidoglycan hydrolase-like protein with peptidoglycan-binding domain
VLPAGASPLFESNLFEKYKLREIQDSRYSLSALQVLWSGACKALRRTQELGITVDGIFSAPLEAAVKFFQQSAGLTSDGIVGPLTRDALPDGGPKPTLQDGSSGAVVRNLRQILTNGAGGQWGTTPRGADGQFGPLTQASVEAFQAWGGVVVDGIVGDQTWSVSLHATSATLETAVGLNFVIN